MSAYLGKGRLPWAKIKIGYTSIPHDAEASLARDSEERDSGDGFLEKRRHEWSDDAPLPIWKNRQFLAAHGVLFAVYIFVLLLVANGKSIGMRQYGMPYSPAVDAVSYEETHFTLEDRIQDSGVFSGKPRPELDRAWHDLLNNENIRIEADYIRHYGKEDTAVAVPGSGDSYYLGTLNVYHELHCLKRLHQYMYSEIYFPDLTPHQKDLNRLHNEHCIDFLRQSAMCHGDVGLITYSWRSDQLFPLANATSHQCVNWDKLERWTAARAVDMMKPGWLIHPTKGVVYPFGEGDKLGAAESHHHRA